MQLANPIPKIRQNTECLCHRPVALVRMGQVETQPGIRKLFKPAAQLLCAPPFMLSPIHILNCELVTEFSPLVCFMNCVGMYNDRPTKIGRASCRERV